ncbi:3-phosphoshikimate 1-carboxyvinyltransferase [bacterium]|nr:3-phosphoshikimate 1-carboxyvinyltransferase [bacterium]
MHQIVRTAARWRAVLSVPGDKSISHRALLFGALASGRSRITRVAPGRDVASTADCLSSLGVRIEREDGNAVVVHGRGPSGLSAPAHDLDAGNSGTTIRLLSGILAGRPFPSVITGDASLRRRPMRRIVEPLERMGGRIETSPEGTAPLRIRGTRLTGADLTLPVASAQLKSCVLLAGLLAEGRTSVTEPAMSRDHTERMLDGMGVRIRRDGLRLELEGPQTPRSCDFDVPGDISSAAFLMVAAACIPESELTIENVGVNPTRTGILDALRRMGCPIEELNPRTLQGEPRADLRIRTASLSGTDIDGDLIPKIIDEIPVLAVAACRARGRTVVRDAAELRVKETDRIAAVARNLSAMGVRAEMFEDGFAIVGPQPLRGAVIDSMEDHRIAMAFTVAGLLAEGETRIEGTECADISYPGFFDLLSGIEYA